MRKIGFTGTEEGMTESQKFVFTSFLENEVSNDNVSEFHFGDCVGADDEAADIADNMSVWLICHPPLNDKYRAWHSSNEWWPAKDYLVRNKDIVDQSDLLIACPKEDNMVVRSGTWATVRYALRCNKPVMVIRPDGKVVEF